MNAKDKMEIEWWESVIKRDHSLRYRAILSYFSLKQGQDVGSVIDFGSGPLCGVLPYLSGDRYAVDPLWDLYKQRFSPIPYPGINKYSIPEISKYKGCFHRIITVNAIDHGDSDFSVLELFSELLKPLGILNLHVHLRAEHQLNEGHDHSLDINQYFEYAEKYFNVINEVINIPDPIPCVDDLRVTDDYKTLICTLQRK